jgi:hypothetical protein
MRRDSGFTALMLVAPVASLNQRSTTHVHSH